MFDLEVAIEDWKLDLAARTSFSQEDISELEEHLRTNIDEQSVRGRSQEEAFAWACYSVGSADRLAAEFGKVSRAPIWRSRVMWMLCGYLGGVAVKSSIGAVSTLSAAALASTGWGGTALGSTAILIAVACWAFLFCMLWRLSNSQAVPSPAFSRLFPWGFIALATFGCLLDFTGKGVLGWSSSHRLFGEYAYTLAIGNVFLSSIVVIAAAVGISMLREKPADRGKVVAAS